MMASFSFGRIGISPPPRSISACLFYVFASTFSAGFDPFGCTKPADIAICSKSAEEISSRLIEP
jgi:hypothetical protein